MDDLSKGRLFNFLGLVFVVLSIVLLPPTIFCSLGVIFGIVGILKGDKLFGIVVIILNIAVLIASILITMWGTTVIQENMELTTLKMSESFLRELENRINDVEIGKTKKIVFDLPGTLLVNPKNDNIIFTIKTNTSIYPLGEFVCLSDSCNKEGIWGEDEFFIIGLQTEKLSDYFSTEYSLTCRKLYNDRTFFVDIVTINNETLTAGKDSKILITKIGEETNNNITVTTIKVDII